MTAPEDNSSNVVCQSAGKLSMNFYGLADGQN